MVSIINEFYQGYFKLTSFELEGEKKEKKEKERSQEEKPNRIRLEEIIINPELLLQSDQPLHHKRLV